MAEASIIPEEQKRQKNELIESSITCLRCHVNSQRSLNISRVGLTVENEETAVRITGLVNAMGKTVFASHKTVPVNDG